MFFVWCKPTLPSNCFVPTFLFYDLFVFTLFGFAVTLLCFIFFIVFFLLLSSFFSLPLFHFLHLLRWRGSKRSRINKGQKEGTEKGRKSNNTSNNTQQTTTEQATTKQATTTTKQQQRKNNCQTKTKRRLGKTKTRPTKNKSPNGLQIAHSSKIGPKIAHSPKRY